MVIAATAKLFDFRQLRELGRLWRSEAVRAVITLLGVTILGVLAGLGLAVGLAVVNLVYRASDPHDAILAQGERGMAFRDITRLDDPLVINGLVIYVDAPLFFANATHFRRRVLALVDRASEPVITVVVDAGAIFYVDSTAIAMLQQLREDLRERGVRLATARMKTPVRHMLDRAGAGDPVADEREFVTVREAAEWFRAQEDGASRDDQPDPRPTVRPPRSAPGRRPRGDPASGD